MSLLLYPPYLQWEVVSECNHKCIHCYNYWRTGKITVDECVDFEGITSHIIERKPIYMAITGGEPLLVFSKLQPCITRLVDAGITVSISTNGTLLDEEIVSYFAEKHVDLVVSLPSIDRDVCDRVCATTGVVDHLTVKFDLLKKYNIQTTINIVLTKLNLSTLYKTLEAVKQLGFEARVGLAQRPINASAEYDQYELDKDDFNLIVKECIRAQKELGMAVDFSVCIPDCAFDNEDDYQQIQKGNCFAGTLAYAIGTNGGVKACQCDTQTYGNILSDKFEDIYRNMSVWRNGSLFPKECADCNKLLHCRGGCHVESYANKGDYSAFPTFGDLKNVPVKFSKMIEVTDYSLETQFKLSEKAIFLQDAECVRVSLGTVAVHLSNEFASWIRKRKSFALSELKADVSVMQMDEIIAILNMLCKNGIISSC